MALENIQELLQLGIQAAKQGNRSAARRLLLQVVDQAPNNELAWIWLASVAETIGQRRDYLERVLAINPKNERAKQALEKIKHSTSVTQSSQQAPELRRSRSTLAERDALLGKPRRSRKKSTLSPTSRALLIAIALVMIGLGFYLYWQESQKTDDEETPTPVAGAFVQPATQTPVPRFVSPTPGGPTYTPYIIESPPPTWTPTATWTPTTVPTETMVPPSLSSYTMLISKQNSAQTVSDLYTISATGADERQIPLTVSVDDTVAGVILQGVFDAAYSPNGSQIVFSAQLQVGSDTFQDLFVAPAAGGEIRRITTLEAEHVESATWSLDNERVAFASDAEGDFNIYVVSINDGTPRRITAHNGVDRDPAWSPVDDTILFATDLAGPGELEIYAMTSTGEEMKRLTDNTNDSFAPAWSPNGQYIAFVSTRRAHNDLYVMEADGLGERALLVRDVAAEEFDPAWSPDGLWIAFSSTREGDALDLFLIAPDGSDIKRVTASDGVTNSRYPDWTPQ